MAQRQGVPEGGWLQTVTQVVGLLAGLATAVYATGAAVLSIRLKFEHLPWGDVVAQLPRELVLSVGAGQVLLPALLVGALYGLFRVLREDRPNPPTGHRWRDGPLIALRSYFVALLSMLAPLTLALGARKVFGHFAPHTGRIFTLLPVLLILAATAVAVQEVRAVLVRNRRSMRRWNSFRAGATMAGVYSVAAIPAIMVAGAAVPFSDAKVCTTDRFEVKGALVGEAGDRVYIGERGAGPRRIVVVPLGRIGTMFIGERAAGESCRSALVPGSRAPDITHNPPR